MATTTYRGHIRDGVVVLDEDVRMDEGAEVRVEVIQPRTMADRLRNAIHIASGLPLDMARNHDHYLHGTPKR